MCLLMTVLDSTESGRTATVVKSPGLPPSISIPQLSHLQNGEINSPTMSMSKEKVCRKCFKCSEQLGFPGDSGGGQPE